MLTQSFAAVSLSPITKHTFKLRLSWTETRRGSCAPAQGLVQAAAGKGCIGSCRQHQSKYWMECQHSFLETIRGNAVGRVSAN